ncbi:MAG: hypothetical protein MUF04_14895 [Akkermansiaceae bacterium]|nr:hypothetical protein [Akkermansiaceae bacterium]
MLDALADGIQRIGQIAIRARDGGGYLLCHQEDAARAGEVDFGGLEVFARPADARRIATYAEDGSYRFLKSQPNLRRGWVMPLESAADLRLALDHFYPAAVGLWLAWRAGRLEVEHLREKLDRQTGMYRSAKGLTDEEARRLMPAVCSHPHCGRRVLWGLAANQPSDQELSAACSGIHPGVPESEAIPLLCAAPCNHFVAECLNAVRQRSRHHPPSHPPAT